jgi:hypothetical protein
MLVKVILLQEASVLTVTVLLETGVAANDLSSKIMLSVLTGREVTSSPPLVSDQF